MATITLKGNAIHTAGNLPTIGTTAPQFTLTKADLSNVTIKDFFGKKVILNIFPSIDTGVCATSVKTFFAKTRTLPNTVVLNISADLPFAQKRFCAAEGIENAVTLSTFRSTFGKDWGVQITDGPLAGLCSRAVVVLNETGKVTYTEQVPEIAQEPNYDAALKGISS